MNMVWVCDEDNEFSQNAIGKSDICITIEFLVFLVFLSSASPVLADMPGESLFPSFESPEHLLVLDMNGIDENLRPALVALQGVVNRVEPRIYLTWTWHGRAWLEDTIATRGITYEEVTDPTGLFLRFRDELSGCIVYDPSVPGTINVATTMAGVLNATIVDPRYSDLLVDFGIPVIADLQGTWSENEVSEMYAWAFENYWRNCTHRILAHLDPHKHHLRDYLVACGVFTFFCDIERQDERDFLEFVFSHVDVEVNTPVLGYFPQYEVFGIANENGCFMVSTNFAPSLTVHSAIEADLPVNQARKPSPLLEDRIYVTFVISDGSGINYNLDHLRYQWEDEARGNVPIGWTTSPLLAELAPAVVEWYFGNATDNDYFMAAPTGIGNMYPTSYPNLSAYTEITKSYMDSMDLAEICVWNFPDQGDLSAARQIIEELDVTAVFENTYESSRRLSGGVYIGTLMQVVCDPAQTRQEKAQEILDSIYDRVPQDRRPAFVCVSLAACDVTPSLLLDVATSLGNDFSVVRPDEFAALLAQVSSMEVLWERKHRTKEVGNADNIVRTGDNTSIIAFNTYRDEEDGPTLTLAKVNDEGSVVWERYHGHGSAECMAPTGAGGAIVVYERDDVYRISRVDKFGNHAWDREITIDWSPRAMIQTDNDIYLIAGSRLIEDAYAICLLSVKDGDGVVREETYPIPPEWINEFFSVRGIAGSANDFFILGESRGHHPIASTAVLLKINGYGSKSWLKKLDISSASRIVESGDGGVIIMGNEIFEDEGFHLVKIDGNGQQVWERGYDSLYINSMVRSQNGSILVGEIISPFEGHYYGDICLVKVDENGRKVWERVYTSHLNDPLEWPRSVAPGKVGGFVGLQEYEDDAYCVRFDDQGERVWEVVIGDMVELTDAAGSGDGGCVASGVTHEMGNGPSDAYLLRIDGDGNDVWKRSYGGNGWDSAQSITTTGDGFIAAGFTTSFGKDDGDIYVFKTNLSGDIVWNITYGTSRRDQAKRVLRCENGCLVGGELSRGPAGGNVFLMRLDDLGEILWASILTGEQRDRLMDIAPNLDGGFYVLARREYPHDGQAHTGINQGYLLLKVDEKGKVIWEKQMEEREEDGPVDEIEFMINDGEGGLVIGGTREVDYSIVIFLARFDGEGESLWERSYEKKHTGEPKDVIRTIDGGFILVGEHGMHLLRVDEEGEHVWEENIGDDIIMYGSRFITGVTGDEFIAGGYSKAMADTWYLIKFREYVHEPVVSLVLFILLVVIMSKARAEYIKNSLLNNSA